MTKIKVQLTIEVPQVPNFFRTSDGQTVPISAVSDEGLRQIADEWHTALLARSKAQSLTPTAAK